VLNTISPTRNYTEQVPSSSVMSHQGTILHGNTSADLTKRLKLQIYYTDSN